MKKETITNKIRKNPCIISTIVLGLFCLILITYNIIGINKIDNWNEGICNKIEGTPSWFDYEGNILKDDKGNQLGYLPIIQKSIENTTERLYLYFTLNNLLKEKLIDERITFVYRDGCIWCNKQIEEFKTLNFWEEYKQSGLVINCTKRLGDK